MKDFFAKFTFGSTQLPEVLTTMFCSGSTQLPEMPGSGLLQEGGYISCQGESQSLLILFMLAFCGLSLEFYTNWNSLYCMCSILFVTTCVTRISSNLKHHFLPYVFRLLFQSSNTKEILENLGVTFNPMVR